MGARLGHAVAALRRDAMIQQFGADGIRHRRAGYAEALQLGQAGIVPHAQLRQEVDGVCRDAEEEARAHLAQPRQQAGAPGQVVDHQFRTDGDGADQRAEAEIVAERAHRVDAGVGAEVPVPGNRAGIRQQGVVGMEDALRLSGRARGKGQIDDAVGIARRRVADRPSRIQTEKGVAVGQGFERRHPIDVAQAFESRQSRPDIPPLRIRPVSRLQDKRRGRHAAQEIKDLLDRVIALQARRANIAVSGAGENRDGGLDAARQPDRDPVARLQPVAGQVIREPVGGLHEGAIGKASQPVAHGLAPRRRRRPSGRQVVNRLGAPMAGSVEGFLSERIGFRQHDGQ